MAEPLPVHQWLPGRIRAGARELRSDQHIRRGSAVHRHRMGDVAKPVPEADGQLPERHLPFRHDDEQAAPSILPHHGLLRRLAGPAHARRAPPVEQHQRLRRLPVGRPVVIKRIVSQIQNACFLHAGCQRFRDKQPLPLPVPLAAQRPALLIEQSQVGKVVHEEAGVEQRQRLGSLMPVAKRQRQVQPFVTVVIDRKLEALGIDPHHIQRGHLLAGFARRPDGHFEPIGQPVPDHILGKSI